MIHYRRSGTPGIYDVWLGVFFIGTARRIDDHQWKAYTPDGVDLTPIVAVSTRTEAGRILRRRASR